MYKMQKIIDRFPSLQDWVDWEVPAYDYDTDKFVLVHQDAEFYEAIKDMSWYALSDVKGQYHSTNMLQITKQIIPVSCAGAEHFNKIYNYIKHNTYFVEGTYTASGNVSKAQQTQRQMAYWINGSANSVQLIIYYVGRWLRIIFRDTNDKISMSGYKAFEIFNDICTSNGIDLESLAIDNGLEVKEDIPPVHISAEANLDTTYYNAHHLDLNSAYMSGIKQAYPVLAPAIDEIYNKRLYAKSIGDTSTADEYKAVLNMTQGYCQSKYCKINGHKFALAHLSKAAIEYCNARVEYFAERIIAEGGTIIAYNTDGIWYQGDIYHDEYEGTGLGMYKNDHTNCKIRFKSAGAYEYIEAGKYKPVVRGATRLDRAKDRADWCWGDIYRIDAASISWAWSDEQGIVDYKEIISDETVPAEVVAEPINNTKKEEKMQSLDDFFAGLM